MATTSTTKDSRIDVRLSVGQKSLLEKAAAVQGKKLSDFVVAASTEAAELALADQNRFSIPEEDMTAFLAKLEEPPHVLPKLQELFQRKSVLES